MTSIVRADNISTVAGTGTVTLEAGNTLDTSAGLVTPAGHVIQIVSTALDGAPAGNSTSFVAIDGYSATITPTSANNKIFIQITGHVGATEDTVAHWRLKRDKNDGNGFVIPFTNSANAGAQDGCIWGFYAHTSYDAAFVYQGISQAFSYLDSPNTTNEITYQIYARSRDGGSEYWRMNRGDSLGDTGRYTSRSSITLMEIAG
jgi:hypothetical protein